MTNPTPEAVERAAFEKWSENRGELILHRDGDGYRQFSTNAAWNAWRAGRALASLPAEVSRSPRVLGKEEAARRFCPLAMGAVVQAAPWFRNHFRCPWCHHAFTDDGETMAPQPCPRCRVESAPVRSEELGDDE